MKNLTSGHLLNNGGLRAHSVGDIYPWRIMATGTANDLVWWVINPAGEKVAFRASPHSAMIMARRLIKMGAA